MLNSNCEGPEDFKLKVFQDPVCFYTVDKICVQTCIITLSYFFYDYILYRMYMDPQEPNVWMVLRHHEVSTIGFISAFMIGFGVPSLVNVVLLCEVSTIFLNYNLIRGANAPVATQIIFIILFVLVRIILLPYVFVLAIIQSMVLWGHVVLV